MTTRTKRAIIICHSVANSSSIKGPNKKEDMAIIGGHQSSGGRIRGRIRAVP